MSYENPTFWTDVDADGNALDWSSRTNKLIYPAYEMLRLAIVERVNFVNTQAGSAIVALPASLNSVISHNELIQKAWFTDFQLTITRLITNPSASFSMWGFFTHLPAAPTYALIDVLNTEAKMLTQIGDVSRISAPTIFNADWEIQQYKMLNAMKVVFFGSIIPDITPTIEYNLFDGGGWLGGAGNPPVGARHTAIEQRRHRFQYSVVNLGGAGNRNVYTGIFITSWATANFAAHGDIEINGNLLAGNNSGSQVVIVDQGASTGTSYTKATWYSGNDAIPVGLNTGYRGNLRVLQDYPFSFNDW